MYFLGLLFFGKSFSKFQLFGPIYLHDFVLALICLLSISFQPRIRVPSLSILLLLLIAALYFFIDVLLLWPDKPLLSMAVRQFGLFLYLLCSFLIFGSQVRTLSESLKAISLIRFIGRLSIYTQIVYLVYGFVFVPGFSLFGKLDYNYFSPLTVMGIITYCADALSNESTPISRTIKFTIGMLLSLTLGHSSAFLAIFVILMLYAYIKIKPVQRLFSFTFIIAALFLLLFLPQFTDFNAGWRLVYWKHILERSFTDGYLIFGHGFGSAYMTYEQAQYIDRVMHSKNMLDEYFPMTRYLNPPHNSVLTIVFHVGLIPALLFFTPLKKTFTQLFLKKSPADPNILFLVLALLGSLVWILFNVILELPHSSTYFWLVYLTTIFYLKENLSITINYEK
jgi:hypothetical protein